jgi:hypothetical protein
MVSSWEEGKICHRSINACLCPLYAIEGMHVVTVEGNSSSLTCSRPERSHSMLPSENRRSIFNFSQTLSNMLALMHRVS